MQFNTFVRPEHLDPRSVHIQAAQYRQGMQATLAWLMEGSEPWPLFPMSQWNLNQLGRPPNFVVYIA